MLRPAVLKASTVVYAAGAAVSAQPSTLIVARVPRITGASVSTTVKVFVAVLDLQPLPSTTYSDAL